MPPRKVSASKAVASVAGNSSSVQKSGSADQTAEESKPAQKRRTLKKEVNGSSSDQSATSATSFQANDVKSTKTGRKLAGRNAADRNKRSSSSEPSGGVVMESANENSKLEEHGSVKLPKKGNNNKSASELPKETPKTDSELASKKREHSSALDNDEIPAKKARKSELPKADSRKSEPDSSEPKLKNTNSRGKKRGGESVSASSASPAKKNKVDHISHTSIPGVVLTVGEGDVGQLGLGPDALEKSRLALVDIPSPIIQVVAGGMHTVCLTVDGDIYTFGCNDEGALGRDTNKEDSETTPAKLTTTMKFVQISAGDSHTAMLTADGQVYACGTFRDANGSIGLDEKGPHKTAVHIPCEKPVVKIVSGSDHLLALAADGTLYSAGCAEQGQLGRVAECFTSRGGRKGLANLVTLSAVHFRGTKQNRHPKVVDMWSGTYVSFAKVDSGEIYAWGLNNYYQLGIEDMQNKFVPTLVKLLPAGQGWKSISGGQHHTVAVNNDGEVYTFGRGTYGQLGLGDGNSADADKPAKVVLITEPCKYAAASSSVSFAVTRKGEAYAWGMGTSKQLSSGAEDDQFEPKLMASKQLNGKEVLMVSCGGQHAVVLAKVKETH